MAFKKYKIKCLRCGGTGQVPKRGYQGSRVGPLGDTEECNLVIQRWIKPAAPHLLSLHDIGNQNLFLGCEGKGYTMIELEEVP